MPQRPNSVLFCKIFDLAVHCASLVLSRCKRKKHSLKSPLLRCWQPKKNCSRQSTNWMHLRDLKCCAKKFSFFRCHFVVSISVRFDIFCRFHYSINNWIGKRLFYVQIEYVGYDFESSPWGGYYCIVFSDFAYLLPLQINHSKGIH